MDFEIVSREDCAVVGDREEMYSKLEQDLISQVKNLDRNTINMHAVVTTPSKRKKKKERTKERNKEKRHKRLLEYQEKLVRTHSLPPSRLMVERENLVGRNLSGEFEQIAGIDGEPIPGAGTTGTRPATEPSPVPRPPPFTENVSPPTISYQPPQSVPVSPLLMPGQTGFNHPSPTIFPSHGQPLGQVTGTTSGSNHFTLSPTPQSFTGPTNGTAGWSDARPVLGSSWDSSYLKPTGFPEWSTSGFLNLPCCLLLCSPVHGIDWCPHTRPSLTLSLEMEAQLTVSTVCSLVQSSMSYQLNTIEDNKSSVNRQ